MSKVNDDYGEITSEKQIFTNIVSINNDFVLDSVVFFFAKHFLLVNILKFFNIIN